MTQVEIKARENGPYKVTGPFRLIDADGNEYEIPDDGKPVVLCRCDSTHSEIGFRAAERAVADIDSG